MMDYGLPHAAQIPDFTVKFNEMPCKAKALAPLSVTHIDIPATPERVWRAIQDPRRV